MGEAKQKEEQAKAFEKLLATPMTREEADKALAQINMQVAQLGVMRIRALAGLNEIDMQLASAEYEKSIIYRRVLIGNDGVKAEEGK